jgi:hypothetical protein
MKMKMKRILKHPSLAIFSCLILGGFFRFHHIASNSLWLDEANSANFLKFPLGSLWHRLAGAESAPAYVYALKLWSFAFGDSEFGLRSFSAIIGLFSIIAIYFLGKSLFGKKTGLWSAFFLSVNYFAIFYSNQSRQYSMVILVSIASSYFFFYLLQKKGGLLIWVLFILVSTLGVFLHPWFFLLFATQFCWLLLLKRSDLLKWISAYSAIFIISFPWIKILIYYRNSGVNDWIKSPAFDAFYQTFNNFLYGSGWPVIILSLFAVISIFFQFEKREIGEETSYKILDKKIDFSKQRPVLSLTAFLLFFPLISAWIISQFFPFYVPGRYEAVVLPFLILLLSFLFSQIESKYLISATLIILTAYAWNSAESEKKISLSYRYNDKTAAQALYSRLENGDSIIFTGLSRPTFDYYLPRLSDKEKAYKEYSFPAETAAHPAFQSERLLLQDKQLLENEAEDLSEKLKGVSSKNIWIIYSLQSPVNDYFFQKMSQKFLCNDFLDLTLADNGPVSPLHFQKIIECTNK